MIRRIRNALLHCSFKGHKPSKPTPYGRTVYCLRCKKRLHHGGLHEGVA